MRPNDRVTFVDPKGKDHPATVTAVVGTGESGFKRLDVRSTSIYGEAVGKDVPHFADHAQGEGYWTLEGEVPKAAEEVEELPDSAPIHERKRRFWE